MRFFSETSMKFGRNRTTEKSVVYKRCRAKVPAYAANAPTSAAALILIMDPKNWTTEQVKYEEQ